MAVAGSLPEKTETYLGGSTDASLFTLRICWCSRVSVYVDPEQSGKGIGLALLEELVALNEVAGIWTLQTGIFPENIGSRCIHEKVGFRTLGIREKIGKQNGVWRDIVLLERRSKTII
ncbi:GNAT family N-acetyltransferase [Pedobacter sp. KBW01]|uniref:GNAT family N-acetyltransferase n=1 Tax=Pedobacter sp. KBW01 TaxID=2153364 RepID=UPI0029392DE9|nr:GNAT family N-acetyltransferase [Pedobacter sp. KBW01]